MNCLECEFPMRMGRASVADAPNTRSHGGFGLCKTCANRKRRDSGPLREDIREGFNEAQAKSALDAWLMGRRRRLEKFEGAWA